MAYFKVSSSRHELLWAFRSIHVPVILLQRMHKFIRPFYKYYFHLIYVFIYFFLYGENFIYLSLHFTVAFHS